MKPLTVHDAQDTVSVNARRADALTRAISFLRARQLKHGEFRTLAATDESLTAHPRSDSALFVTALVLYAIGFCDDPHVATMITRGLDFLASEMKGAGLWSYWSSRNKKAALLPPDLDDICCISFLMEKYARPFPTNQSLILANRDARGLFYTWLAARPDTPRKFVKHIRQVSDADVERVLSLSGTLDNIDCAVNANVLLYLGELSETRAALDWLVETVLDDCVQARSTFYVHPFSLYYLVSRAYAQGVGALGQVRNAVVEKIESLQKENGSCGNALLTALAACTLQNFHSKSSALERAIRALLDCQNADGSWARHGMFLGPAPYYGSEELTTALCVEALSEYHDETFEVFGQSSHRQHSR